MSLQFVSFLGFNFAFKRLFRKLFMLSSIDELKIDLIRDMLFYPSSFDYV